MQTRDGPLCNLSEARPPASPKLQRGEKGDPRISIIAPTGSHGYPYYIGACARFLEANLDGILPEPSHLAGVSSGGIAMASVMPWTRRNMSILLDVTGNLKPGDIYEYSSFLKQRLGTIIALGIADHFTDILFNKLRKKNRNAAYFLKGMEVFIGIGLEIIFLHQFIATPSLFSTKPLKHLLEKNLDFRGIYNSKIRLDLITVDRKSGQSEIFSNQLKTEIDFEEWQAYFLDGLLASSSIPGYFPPILRNSMELVDGGILTSAPIRQARKVNADIIVLLLPRGFNDRGTNGRNGNKSAIENLHECWYLTGQEALRKSVESHQKVNQNILVLKEFLEKEQSEELRKITDRFSFSRKKYIPIILVPPDTPIPDMGFQDFDKEGLMVSMEAGYRAMDMAIPKILEEVKKLEFSA